MSLYLQDRAANQRACIPAMAQGRTHGAARRWMRGCTATNTSASAHPPVVGAGAVEVLLEVVGADVSHDVLELLLEVVGAGSPELLMRVVGAGAPKLLLEVVGAGVPELLLKDLVVVDGCEVAHR